MTTHLKKPQTIRVFSEAPKQPLAANVSLRLQHDTEETAPAASNDPTLRLLVARAAEGDEHAWRQLVQQYSPRLFALAKSKLGSSDAAEELTQSVFATVAAKLRKYTEQDRFEAWLFRIAMNRIRDEIRRRARRGKRAAAEIIDHCESPTQSPLETDEQTTALRAALAQLPEADRDVIHLRHTAGLQFKQIALVRKEPIGTTLARHHRALEKLRAILQNHAPEQRSAAL